jgi:hypothetical protein
VIVNRMYMPNITIDSKNIGEETKIRASGDRVDPATRIVWLEVCRILL